MAVGKKNTAWLGVPSVARKSTTSVAEAKATCWRNTFGLVRGPKRQILTAACLFRKTGIDEDIIYAYNKMGFIVGWNTTHTGSSSGVECRYQRISKEVSE